MKTTQSKKWVLCILILVLFFVPIVACSQGNRSVKYSNGEKTYFLNKKYDPEKMWTLSGQVVMLSDFGFCEPSCGFGFLLTDAMRMAINARSINGTALDQFSFAFSFNPDQAIDHIDTILREELSKEAEQQLFERLEELRWDYMMIFRLEKNNSKSKERFNFWKEKFPKNELIGSYQKNSWYFLSVENPRKENMSDGDLFEAQALLDDLENFKSHLVLFPPKAPVVEKASKPSKVHLKKFSTHSLDGETFTEAYFAQYDLTLVNVWATFCSPCVFEMPALAKLAQMLAEKENMGIISICTDLSGREQKALSILEDAKVFYPVLYPSSEIQNSLLEFISGVPTTLIVNSKGEMVGELQIGVPGRNHDEIAQKYLEMMETGYRLLKK